MPKALILGNGSMLVAVDGYGSVDDVYYPYVGLEDHITQDAVNKLGVWVDGDFRWLSDAGWERNITYEEETLVGKIIATSNDLGLRLQISDVVYNEEAIYVRKVTVKNLLNRQRYVKIYFNHQLRMYGIKKGDTVYYDPNDNTIVHYKGRRIAVIGGLSDGQSFDEYCVGLSNIEGKLGTWKDAEDGRLAGNPIEHGTVDSTIGFEKHIDSEGEHTLYVWICISKSLERSKTRHNYVLTKTPEHIFESTGDYWHAWVNKTPFTFYKLDREVVDLFKRSLLIVRTHMDKVGGVIASADSDILKYGRDDYNYVWHRDGAFVAMAMDRAGYYEVTKRFYEFCNETLSNDGYFYHKYRPDRSQGASWHPWVSAEGREQLPIQEDETALVLVALWQHYVYTKDLEYIEKIYNSLIKKAGNFLLGFRGVEKLPNPSYDIWEEKYGIHTFTVSSIYAALMAASSFADLLGKEEDSNQYLRGAEQVKEALLKHLYSQELGYFYKMINFKDGETLHDATIDASSFYAVFRFNVLEPGDKRLEQAYNVLREKLLCLGDCGGVARYVGDHYYRVDRDYAGNSWIVTTMWMAQYQIANATKESDMQEVRDWLKWVVTLTNEAGILPEQINPFTGEQLSVAPLTWSHAEFVNTVLLYLEKLESLGVCTVIFSNKDSK